MATLSDSLLVTGGCAHANGPVVLEHPAEAAVSQLPDLPSMPGAHLVALLRNGESDEGEFDSIDGNVLVGTFTTFGSGQFEFRARADAPRTPNTTASEREASRRSG